MQNRTQTVPFSFQNRTQTVPFFDRGRSKMALNDSLKKIKIDSVDTTGLYYKDSSSIFSKKELNKNDLKKLDYKNISIVVKFYFRNKQIKKTLKFTNMTGLNAIKQAATIRYDLKEELEAKGVIQKKEFKTLNELWADYIDFKSESLSKENIYTSSKFYDKWVKPNIGKMNINKVNTADIQDIVNLILRDGKKPRTAQTAKQILRPCFNYAIDIGVAHLNPTNKVNIPSFDNTVNFQLTEEKRKALFAEIMNYKIPKYKGIMLLIYFGRRLNEALTLQWPSIDFEQKTYTIEGTYSKIRKRQEYPLLKPLEDFLNEYETKKRGYIFPGEKSKHVTASTFRRHWKVVLDNACIDKMRIHDTRHLLGNTMVDRGESLENIGKVLGHSSTAVTKRYAKTSLDTADRLLNDYLE